MARALGLLYRLLEIPFVFAVSQRFGAGTVAGYHDHIARFVALRPGQSVLDVGCGVGAFRPVLGDAYTGVDVNPDYIAEAASRHSGRFLAMNAARLEFADASFDHVLSIATFHHLSDAEVVATVAEALRVCKPDGAVHIVDAIFPETYRNPLQWLLFAMDRGRHPRRFATLRALLAGHFRLGEAVVRPGFPHYSCYIRILR
ncbi:MAG: class I SAM-dependent methyltransferase [Magnetospirillum sp.]|nr:class I SAM-dependent methyltransferase [Magnetospirillum sp.]